MQRLLSVRDAAKQVLGGVGESTLRRWITEGRVPVVRLGRRLFIQTQALDEFIKSGEQVHEKGGRVSDRKHGHGVGA